MKRNIVFVCETSDKRSSKAYNYEKINIMRNMLLAVNAEYDQLIVLTNEDPELIHPEFQVIPLISGEHWNGWWSKIQIFNKDLPIEGEILYIDLDCIPYKHFNKLWHIHKGAACMRQAVSVDNNQHKLYNSSINNQLFSSSFMRFEHGYFDLIYKLYNDREFYNNWVENKIEINGNIRHMIGDEPFICDIIHNNNLTVQSISNSMIPMYQQLIRNSDNKMRIDRKNIPEHITIPDDISILMFGGPYKPWTVLKYDKTIEGLYK